jgi:hypothetical protein
MKRTFKWLFFLSIVLAVLALVSGLGLWHEALNLNNGHPDISLSINGDDVDLDALSALPWLGALFGLAVTSVVLCIVLPLVVLLGIGLPLLICGALLAAVLVGAMSLGALLFSPLIVIGLLLWLLLRTKKPRASRASISA